MVKEKANRDATASILEDLTFKSNQEAFEYACMFLNNSIENQEPALAIVFSTRGNYASIKLANAWDNSMPTQHPMEIENVANICLAAEKLDRVPPLKKGDLVMFVVPKELAVEMDCAAGLVVAKVKPVFSLHRTAWKVTTS